MTLLLSDEEVQGLLTVEMCLESLEEAYREWGEASRAEIRNWLPQSPAAVGS